MGVLRQWWDKIPVPEQKVIISLVASVFLAVVGSGAFSVVGTGYHVAVMVDSVVLLSAVTTAVIRWLTDRLGAVATP